MPFFKGSPDEIWSNYIRFIGAGAVLVGGIIEFIKVIFKILKHLKGSKVWLVLFVGVVLGVLSGILVPELGVWGGIFGAIFGIIFSYVSANTTAIVGSSSNPVSGMTIASLVVVSILFKFMGLSSISSVLAFSTLVASAASIAGDIVQDLKTGYMVRATPRYQYIAEFVGITVSFIVMIYIISILGKIYGFGSKDLPSPQGVLMGTIAEGIFKGNISGGLLLGGIIAKLLGRENENIFPSGMIAGDGITSILFAVGVGMLGWSFKPPPNITSVVSVAILLLSFVFAWKVFFKKF